VVRTSELKQEINEAHERFFAALAGFEDADLEMKPISGVWSARDVAGHMTDWHLEIIDSVERIRSNQPPRRPIRDVDAWNHDQAAIRGIQPWAEAAEDLRQAWSRVIETLDQIDDDELERKGPYPTGTVEPLRSFFRRLIARHVANHATEAERFRMRMLGIRDRGEQG
jgi:uncharacterized damage-inducible protein DinB